MPRPLRRLLTALSLLVLIAVLVFWTRAQWRQDMVLCRASTSDARTLCYTVTTLFTTRGSLSLGDHEVRRALTPAPAAAQLRRQDGALDGWVWATSSPESLPNLTAAPAFLGFAWQSNGPFIEIAGPRATTQPDPGWQTAESRTREFALPWWFLAVVFAILPALSLRRCLRAKRHRPGTCPQCGYDLRASPTQCPECGRPTDAPTRTLPSHS